MEGGLVPRAGGADDVGEKGRETTRVTEPTTVFSLFTLSLSFFSLFPVGNHEQLPG